MGYFNIDYKRFILTIVAVAIPLTLLNLPKGAGLGMGPLSSFIGASQVGLEYLGRGVRSTVEQYLLLLNVKDHARTLASQNALLRAELLVLSEIKAENDRLRRLLDFSQAHPMKLLGARVVGRDLFSDQATVRIDRGTYHSIEEGMAVMTTEGVVGYIYKPQRFTSQVLLLTDGYAVVDAIVQRTRARGIVEGNSGRFCTLRYLERAEDVALGDLIVTSGLDDIFPKGLPIAKVSHIESFYSGISLRVDLVPIVDPGKIEEVFVVLKTNGADLSDEKVPQ